MVRPVGGAAARGQRRVAPSAGELNLAIGNQFGPRQLAGIEKITGSDFAGLPAASSYGEFDEIISVINDASTMDYYKTDKQRKMSENLAGESAYKDQYFDPTGETGNSRTFYEYDEAADEYYVPGYKGPQNEEDTSAAPLTVVPTSTTNPARPRTVAAGYDKDEEKITVVFRDGTFYNYYEVTTSEWQAFKARVSKGQYIYRYLDFKPRGPADTGSISAVARKAFYRLSRAAQIQYKGKQGKPPKPQKP
jgi:hypothetical protein